MWFLHIYSEVSLNMFNRTYSQKYLHKILALMKHYKLCTASRAALGKFDGLLTNDLSQMSQLASSKARKSCEDKKIPWLYLNFPFRLLVHHHSYCGISLGAPLPLDCIFVQAWCSWCAHSKTLYRHCTVPRVLARLVYLIVY